MNTPILDLLLLRPPKAAQVPIITRFPYPLLSNPMLDVLDRELEKRGHRFVRHADDCNIHVRSRRAGERVMASVTRFLRLRTSLRFGSGASWERGLPARP